MITSIVVTIVIIVVVACLSPSPPGLQIFGKTITGNMITLVSKHLSRSTTPRRRARKIGRIASYQQRLIFAGEQMENGHTLNAYGVQYNSTISECCVSAEVPRPAALTGRLLRNWRALA